MSKRNIIWLVVVIAVGAIAWITLGWVWGLVGAALTLAVSEVVERRARRQRLAARDRA